MIDTLYRRPLPADVIAFSSAQGRQLFAEELARSKYPPHWISAERLWGAMQTVDPAHRDVVAATRSAVRALAAFPHVSAAVGPDRAEAVSWTGSRSRKRGVRWPRAPIPSTSRS